MQYIMHINHTNLQFPILTLPYSPQLPTFKFCNFPLYFLWRSWCLFQLGTAWQLWKHQFTTCDKRQAVYWGNNWMPLPLHLAWVQGELLIKLINISDRWQNIFGSLTKYFEIADKIFSIHWQNIFRSLTGKSLLIWEVTVSSSSLDLLQSM